MIDTPIITSSIGQGGGNAGGTSSSGNKTAVLQIPSGLQNLKPGSVINAVVIGKDANTNTRLNIQNNELTVSSKITLETQSQVTLKILSNNVNASGNATFKAQLVSVNGQPPNLPNNAQGQTIPNSDILRAVLPATSQSTTTTTQNTNTDATLLNISKGAILSGVIIKPSQGASKYLPTPNAASSAATQAYGGTSANTTLQSSDKVQLHVLTTQNVTNTVSTATPSTAAPSTYNAYQKTDTSAAQNSAKNTTSQEAVSAFASRNTPNLQNSAITPLTSNQTFTGTVIGTEKSGEAVISTPLGTIKIALSTPLAQGSQLLLEVTSYTQKTDISQSSSQEAQLVASNYKHALTAQNSAFEQLFSAMKALELETGKTLIKETFPNTQNQAAAKLLWFVFNAQGGTAANWLGQETANQLNKEPHKGLLKRLEGAFSNIKSLFSEPNAAGFHTLVFPFYDGKDIQYGRFYTRSDEEADKKGDIRFLVEIDFDTFGEFQLDGFIHNPQSANITAKQFDLYVRSKEEVKDIMRADIIKLFDESLKSSGLVGNISFQTVNVFPVLPDNAPEHIHADDEIIV